MREGAAHGVVGVVVLDHEKVSGTRVLDRVPDKGRVDDVYRQHLESEPAASEQWSRHQLVQPLLVPEDLERPFTVRKSLGPAWVAGDPGADRYERLALSGGEALARRPSEFGRPRVPQAIAHGCRGQPVDVSTYEGRQRRVAGAVPVAETLGQRDLLRCFQLGHRVVQQLALCRFAGDVGRRAGEDLPEPVEVDGERSFFSQSSRESGGSAAEIGRLGHGSETVVSLLADRYPAAPLGGRPPVARLAMCSSTTR